MYKQFTKEQFDSTLTKIAEKYHLAKAYEIDTDYFEHVYIMSTRNRSVQILIYSSVDKRTNRMRSKASDAVRIVMKWNTKRGEVYKALAKHLRIKTLFVNIRKTLVSASESVFNLSFKDFSQNPIYNV